MRLTKSATSWNRGRELKYYPIFLNLIRKKILVVGAGAVAARKIKAMLSLGCRIKVVAPRAVPSIQRLAQSGKITWIARKYRVDDLKGVWLVVAATSDWRVNAAISREAKKEVALVNVVDQPSLWNFISPAVFRNVRTVVAVSTDGKDPKLSRDLKNFLTQRWPDFLMFRKHSQKNILDLDSDAAR